MVRASAEDGLQEASGLNLVENLLLMTSSETIELSFLNNWVSSPAGIIEMTDNPEGF